MGDILLLIGVVVIWFVVNRYVLPRMGIQT
jgi:hypothetical protein